MQENTVIILRGLSGAGKSTYAERRYPLGFICSADQFFEDENGKRNYDANKIKIAHHYCRNAFLAGLKNNLPTIIIDNTNVKLWHFKFYVDQALKYNYKVSVIRITEDPKVASARNIHDVPEKHVLIMNEIFEDYPDEVVYPASKMIEEFTI